ncbi:glycosyltransferase family 2 protein [Pseudovibrio sp. Tun.PSC04-5.I4]|uniref:glycosyltransferase family 2 protein n=1 Tax=Pseudovibrio sp. Tun.PSC04-5.I4 TaxID=1798213 RepID=UPI000888EF25|nr:glycosyltransferase family 2 protein [Pseudovibrio sp. Tun.PSC04-5.I4]SDQ15259.1 Glycosyltransferase involved in cell wall bisynthesis [Pseudovibrio sp. Tun.PSC04-5.I4]
MQRQEHPSRLIISVCTRGRSNMLLDCISSISRILPTEALQVEVLVCDNNTLEMDTADKAILKSAITHTFHYTHEARAGIPFARNAAIEKALTLCPDWIAFIDDDERIDDDWLVLIAEAMKKWPATVYHGWTQSTPEDLEAPWAFQVARNKRAAGTKMRSAGTDNVVFCSSLVQTMPAGNGLRFDENMRFSGGSDLDFFYRVTDLGHSIIWVPEAIAREKIPLARLTFQYQIRRSYSVAAAQTYITRKRLGTRSYARKILFKGLGRFFAGIFGLILASITFPFLEITARKWLLKSSKKIACAFGIVAGFNQKLGNIYKQIDGS